jgi:uncharacterized protein (TIGR02266 family)
VGAKIEMVLPVRFSVETRAVQTTTRELSEDGVFVRCLEPPAAGARETLKLYLPGFSAAAEFVGLVREVETATASAGFWADFVSASHDAHERLLQVLRPDAGKKSPPVAPVPLGSLYKRVHVSHGLPPPPAAPTGVPLPEEQPRSAAADVAGLIQGALDEAVAQKAAEVLRARRGSSPGKKKTPPPKPVPQPEQQQPEAAPRAPPPPAPHAPGVSVSSASRPVLSSAPGEVSLAGDMTAEANGRNRRSFPRYRARFAVRFSSVQDFVLEYAANISAGGVFVVTDFPPAMDSIITVVLELPDGGAPVSCKAQVVHLVSKEEAQERGVQAGAGVQFVEADDAFRERIDQTISQILDKVPA